MRHLQPGFEATGSKAMKTWILEPFAWEDDKGNLHLDVPEILRYLDIPNTPENRTRATMMIVDMVREQSPASEIRVCDLEPN